MRCMCSQPCRLWQELQQAQNKYEFMNKYCLPPNLDGNYTWFPKETLKCCACYLAAVNEAVKCKQINLTFEQDADVIEKHNRAKFYYERYDELHESETTWWQRWLAWWKKESQ